ncbi:hypothetical protein [Armatimonas sp.]|uniref:hypothetical protein n=1 Tax=Armatimonas sp. TaxID=1872638 RepID=UPI0037531270
MKNLKFKISLILAVTFVSALPAIADADGHVTMNSIVGYGNLTPTRWFDEGSGTPPSGSSKSRQARSGLQNSGSGGAHAVITNNTGANYTLNAPPTMFYSVDGSSNQYYANSSSSVILDGVEAKGMCNGPFGFYGTGGNTNQQLSFWGSGSATILDGDSIQKDGIRSIFVHG